MLHQCLSDQGCLKRLNHRFRKPKQLDFGTKKFLGGSELRLCDCEVISIRAESLWLNNSALVITHIPILSTQQNSMIWIRNSKLGQCDEKFSEQLNLNALPHAHIY